MSRKNTGTASHGGPSACLPTAISFWATTACPRATAAPGGMSNGRTFTAKPCLSTGPWTRWAVSGKAVLPGGAGGAACQPILTEILRERSGSYSPSQEPQHQREQRAQHDTSGHWKVEAGVPAVHVDIAGQVAELDRQPPGEADQQARDYQRDAERDE